MVITALTNTYITQKGGWTLGEPRAYDAFMMRICDKIKAVCISVDYSLGKFVRDAQDEFVE